MSDTQKHTISFVLGAKDHLDVVAGLPDLNTETEDNGLTDICMFFGAAAYYAQFFEASLADFLVTYRRWAEEIDLDSAIQTLEETLHKKTMGTLLTDMRKVFTFDDTEIDSLLSDALKKRNFLMHEFFRTHEADLQSSQNHQHIFQELVEIGLVFKKAMYAMRGMNVALQNILQDME